MANFNKVILIGRLTRDPEVRTFGTGGKVAAFGFAVTNRKKNAQTGQWEDEPMFIDVDAFNWGQTGTLANIVEQYCRKGAQICVEGRLKLDSWDDKTTGQKRQKHKIVAEAIQLLDARPAGQGGTSGGAPRSNAPPASHNDGGGYSSPPPDDMHDEPPPASSGGTGEEIPF